VTRPIATLMQDLPAEGPHAGKVKMNIWISADLAERLYAIVGRAKTQAFREGKGRRAASISAVMEEALETGITDTPALIRRVLDNAEADGE
jgi:hypothetical protein